MPNMDKRQRGQISGTALSLLAAVLILPGCGAVDQVETQVNRAVADVANVVIVGQLRDALKRSGIDIKSGPNCADNPSGKKDSTIDIVCTGKTSDGKAINGHFKAVIDGSNCSGLISLKVGAKEILGGQSFNPCRSL
ncbi:MAG: hypothetical protein NTV40_03660 [Solirubrobacterales bacterium]|nr:hypothetical protein [Solirubrobacterales bacterium]